MELIQKFMDTEESRNFSEAQDILKDLSPEQKDSLYRAIWAERVIDDIYAHAEDYDMDITDEQAVHAAYLHVYQGEYDCNMAYWTNIANNIENATKN